MPNWLDFRHSIFIKFSLAFLVVGLIPLTVLSFLTLVQSANQLERQTNNRFRQVVYQMGKNVDDIFKGFNETSKLMYFRTDNALSSLDSTLVQQANGSKLDEFMRTVLYSNGYIESVLFVRTSDRAVFYRSRTSKTMEPNALYPPIEWRKDLLLQPKQMAVFVPHPQTYFGSLNQVLTVGRNYIDTTVKVRAQPPILGTLYLDVDLSAFGELFKRLQLGKRDELYILDKDENVLYCNLPDRIGNRFDTDGLKGRSDVLSYTEAIPFIGGQVVALSPKSDLYASIDQIKKSVLVASVICLIALVVMGILFSRTFAGPILAIMRQMNRVESGQLDAILQVTSKDELGRLTHGFNRMIERLKSFINDSYIAEIKRKQTELSALKNQIRPHYLYNTLEVIRMNAVAHDDEQVADMIHALSKQLKYVIDYGEDWVTVRRELEHLRDYFHLIEVRYNRRIKMQVEIQNEELLSYYVLKLSIQPIVENAIQHGILPKGGKGAVLISVERDDDRLAITIYDDGVGIDVSEVERLNGYLAENVGALGKSVGMKNVHERIKNACGGEYGLDIRSRPLAGTSVRMTYPLQKEGRDENHSGSSGG